MGKKPGCQGFPHIFLRLAAMVNRFLSPGSLHTLLCAHLLLGKNKRWWVGWVGGGGERFCSRSMFYVFGNIYRNKGESHPGD
jgi:hypothetical protein